MYNSQAIIDEFFKKDGTVTQFGTTKRSILLALIEDMKYCVQLPGKWYSIELNSEQWKKMQKILPSFTVVLQFCSAVDLLARVWKANKPPNGKNALYFKSCLTRWFQTSSAIADILWDFRNGMSHGYNLLNNSALRQYGSSQFIVRDSRNHYTLYLHAMYATTAKASDTLYGFISNQSEGRKRSIARYLEEYGFVYTI